MTKLWSNFLGLILIFCQQERCFYLEEASKLRCFLFEKIGKGNAEGRILEDAISVKIKKKFNNDLDMDKLSDRWNVQ